MNARARERQQMLAHLQRALALGQFELHYQRRVNLTSRAIIGVEALLRWRHRLHGVIAPSRFLAAAEDSGLIVPIGQWVLRAACLQAKSWADGGLAVGSVAVNISAQEFFHYDFCCGLRRMLEQTGLPSRCLELDITEATLMDDAAASNTILAELKSTGVTLAIDDFGTGYSSLRHLQRYPVDALKIDLSLIRGIGSGSGGGSGSGSGSMTDDGTVVGAIVALGASLGRRVVAEGVEQDAQLNLLRQYRCHEGQGYLFSPPLPASDFAALLTRQREVAAKPA